MRRLIKNTITEDEAAELLRITAPKRNHGSALTSRIRTSYITLFKNNEILNKILNQAYQYTSISEVVKPSYINMSSGKGTRWHRDTGTSNHMPWCKFGLSTLLTKPRKNGAIFEYKDPEFRYSEEEHYLSTIIHSSDEMHKISNDYKDRVALLLFLG